MKNKIKKLNDFGIYKYRNLYQNAIVYIDRIDLWIETNRKIFNKDDIKTLKMYGCTITAKAKIMNEFKVEFRQTIKIFQPNLKSINYIIEKIKNHGNYRINRIELAYDWIASNEKKAKAIHEILSKHFVYCAGNKYSYGSYIDKNKKYQTDYFARRKPEIKKDLDSNKFIIVSNSDKVIPVMYSSRRNKILDKHCAHFEIRLVGSQACKSSGFRTLRDFNNQYIVDFILT